MKIDENWKINDNLYKCPYCGILKTKMGICSHIICVHTTNGINRINNSLKKCHGKTHKPWNKGLTKENNESIKRASEKMIGNIPWNKGIKLSKEQCNKISNYMKDVAKKRIHTWKIGRGKNGKYKGFWCDSSWELAYVIYCLDHNVNIIRNTIGFSYIWENSEHTYYPDFYNKDTNEYIEIKGYENDKDKEKIKQFKGIIKVYYYKDMKPILKYVKEKYGEDFIKLYD
ncbi:MAG: hypothetical protein IJ880_11435 [Bacilli bacterium]|nr:hypothetical protein [Bacilli bacterium]